MKITRLEVGLRPSKRVERDYAAEAIEHDGRYFYRVGDTTIEITRFEYQRGIENPVLYYFSTALILHNEMESARANGSGQNWPEGPAAPIDPENPWRCKGPHQGPEDSGSTDPGE